LSDTRLLRKRNKPSGSNRAVFLDRDGVLNRSLLKDGNPYPPPSLKELEILPYVPEALAILKNAGFLLICVTNQPDVARGKQKKEIVEAIHKKLLNLLCLEEILTCYHDDRDHCQCRKPLPGLLLKAAEKYSIDFSQSFMVGDRWRDIEAGENAGCRTILIDYGYQEKGPLTAANLKVTSLKEAADWIINQIKSTEESMKSLEGLKIKLFADGADKNGMMEMYQKPYIKGFTTNPTLMRKAGISDYEAFARDIIKSIPDRSLSLEVFSDEFDEMSRQARKISSWGDNVYVKIPVTNTKGISSAPLVRDLTKAGVKVNVTALMTLEQVQETSQAILNGTPAYISVFAGRIADSGRDPLPIMSTALTHLVQYPHIELIWASPRELLNVFQADQIGCHIITATNDILKKLSLIGKDLTEYSLDTVKMFYDDAQKAGYKI